MAAVGTGVAARSIRAPHGRVPALPGEVCCHQFVPPFYPPGVARGPSRGSTPFVPGPWACEMSMSEQNCDFDDGCYECGGEGWILDECFEDTCCCANPDAQHDYIPCPVCNPKGR
jgi:hypothetical protein